MTASNPENRETILSSLDTSLLQVVAARFWKSVDCSAGPDACWPWRRCRQTKGYGCFAIDREHNELAHRAAFFFTHGHWPVVAMHSCDNRLCCNPHHLSDGTIALNNADMKAKGRYNLSGLKQFATAVAS